MARHEKDYDRDYGSGEYRDDRSEGPRQDRWSQQDRQGRDSRDDEFRSGGRQDSERGAYNRDYRDDGFDGGTRGYQGGQRGYGMERGSMGRDGYGMSGDAGYGGRDHYMEGWQDQRGGMSPRTGRPASHGWIRPRASEIMTENPHMVTPDATIGDVAMRMRDLDVGIIPVVDDMESRRLRGVITDRDITIRAVARGLGVDAQVSDCMTDGVCAVNKNDSIQEVMRVMGREQVRRVPVTDREGRLVGIIAQADLAIDYAGDDRFRETEVGETIERISEPAQPDQPGMTASGRSSRDSTDSSDAPRKGSRSRRGKEN